MYGGDHKGMVLVVTARRGGDDQLSRLPCWQLDLVICTEPG